MLHIGSAILSLRLWTTSRLSICHWYYRHRIKSLLMFSFPASYVASTPLRWNHRALPVSGTHRLSLRHTIISVYVGPTDCSFGSLGFSRNCFAPLLIFLRNLTPTPNLTQFLSLRDSFLRVSEVPNPRLSVILTGKSQDRGETLAFLKCGGI